MTARTPSKEQATTRAEKAFKSAQQRDTTSKQITDTEYATAAAKTKKLRALRLAKQAAHLSEDKESASDQATNRSKKR